MTGREERYDGFEGEPRGIHGSSHHHTSNAGPHGTVGNKVDPRVDSDLDGSRNLGASSGTTGSRSAGMTGDSTSTGLGNRDSVGAPGGANTTQTASGASAAKPSMMDRLNPLKDSDRDGKKGLMD